MEPKPVEHFIVTLTAEEAASLDAWRDENGGLTKEGAARELMKLALCSVRTRPRLIAMNGQRL